MKVQNPIIGRATGSAGGMTFSKVYDKNVARAKAFEVNNPKTTAQQTQRAFFAELTALCSDFSDDQLRFLFPNKPKTMSRRNAISKQIAESYTVDGTTKSIDFDHIDTLGNAPVSNFGDIDIGITENNMYCDIPNFYAANAALGDNYFVVVFINVTKQQISFTTECKQVKDNTTEFSIPSGWESDDIINAIPLVTNSIEDVSTKGFGSFIIKVRPEKKNV